MTITPPKVFKLLNDIHPGVSVIKAGTLLWMHGNRSSSLGGYIATMSEAYVSRRTKDGQPAYYSPQPWKFTYPLERMELEPLA